MSLVKNTWKNKEKERRMHLDREINIVSLTNTRIFSLCCPLSSPLLYFSFIFAKMIVNSSDKESEGIEKDMALVACRWKSQLVSSTLGVGYVESFGCFVECKSIGNWITLQRTIRDRDLCGTVLYRIFKCSRGKAFLFAKLLRKIESRRFVDCNRNILRMITSRMSILDSRI